MKRQFAAHKSYKYARGVINHEIPSPKYVIKQCEKFIEICEGKNEKYFIDNDKLQRIDSILKFLIMPKGLKSGQNIYDCSCGYQWLLYVSALCVVYRENPNKRRYETVILEVGRKNFKTFTIATIFILLFLLEPKFSKFYSVAPDGALSREVKTAIEEILKSSPLVYLYKGIPRFKILRDYIEFNLTESRYIPLNYSNSRMDGKLPNVFLADEVGALPNSYAIEAMRSGQLNILNKLGCIISTKYPTANNPFEDEVNYAKRILDGTQNDETVFSLLYEPNNTEDWTFDDTILKQANPVSLEIPEIWEDLEPLGLNFIKLGLQDVLFNPVTKEVYTPNANKVINVTPSNIGAVPNTRKINNKALSADITLTPSDIGAAASSHGNHVPTMQTANNKVFLRNDNSWQTVTPANIGAVPTTRKVNNKALSADIALSYSDVGAANEQHNHSADEISSGTLPIEKGGTNASTFTQALENLGGVPKTRTVNNKALSSDISLTASDVGAATTAQGTKADSALQGVKVNGTLVTPDSNKTVNIDATSINAATPEQGAKADSAIQGIHGNGTTITPNANKIVNITPSNIGAAASSHGNHVPTIQTASNKIFLRNDNTWQTVTPSNIGAAASSHNHSASNITSGTLPISRGGTGATSASTALSNLGMIISSGTWTPTLSARDGTAPTYTLGYRYARYYRINNLVYITFHMKVNISNQGTDYACVKGLPFTASNNMNSQSLALHECYGGIDQRPATANICDSSSIIYLQNSSGECALQWKTGDLWIGFSGCYIKS